MPSLPKKAKEPARRKADGRAQACSLTDHPHEREEAVRRIQAPNAAHDKQPLMHGSQQGGKDPACYGQASGEVLPPAAVIGLRAARAAREERHRKKHRGSGRSDHKMHRSLGNASGEEDVDE